jgi:hypothetical protein
VANVLSLAVSLPGQKTRPRLLAASDQGSILPINQSGSHDPPVEVAGRAVLYVLAAGVSGPRPTSYCGLAYDAAGRLTALGLDSTLREVWSYGLPAGAAKRPIPLVASAPPAEGHRGQWWMTAPDGSIHVVSDDGRFSDHFSLGQHPNGLAVTRVGRRRVLLVSTENGVTAYGVEGVLESDSP